MILAGFLLFLSLAGESASTGPESGWISDGARQCTFDANIGKPPTRCEQYHQVIAHKLKSGQAWNEYRWMWKDGRFEVQYTSSSGLLGVSPFTIGELTYRNVGSSKYTKVQAASYSASREELVIGVPGEGYQFSMEGAL